MVKVREDMTGWRMWEHGVEESILTVIKQVEDYISPQGIHYAQWLCVCECGNNIVVTGSDLRRGHTISCGCLKKERIIVANINAKKYNKYDLTGEFGVGYTSNTNKEFYFDLEDFDKIKNYCWSEQIDDNGYHSIYAWDKNTNKIVKIHHIIFGKYCDHANRNTLDNRKKNLREATLYDNAANHSIRKDNKSGVTGVSWNNNEQLWIAQLKQHGKLVLYERFINKEDAIKSRLNAEVKYFKEFAPQQHLFKEYGIINNMTERIRTYVK